MFLYAGPRVRSRPSKAPVSMKRFRKFPETLLAVRTRIYEIFCPGRDVTAHCSISTKRPHTNAAYAYTAAAAAQHLVRKRETGVYLRRRTNEDSFGEREWGGEHSSETIIKKTADLITVPTCRFLIRRYRIRTLN